MMQKNATARTRIEPHLKREVEAIFHVLGLTTSQAITLFFKQVKLNKGLPFAIKIPNKTTQKVFQATDAGKNLIRCRDSEDFFKRLEI